MGINHIELVLLALVLLVSALAVIAKRLQIAYPIVMVIGGLLLSLIPRVPRVSLNPDLVFLVILPPLLFSAAYHTSWREFQRNFISIILLAFGLVGFSIFGVAAATRLLFPGFDWHVGLVLGAVVAATDAIAATATAKRLGLPRRITDLLEAESLVNDGSGLVALRFTLAMVVTGVTPSVASGAWTLFYLVSMAVAIGLAVGVLAQRIQKRITDSPIEITISLATPFVTYLAAEAMHCSGVLATLACGIFLGRSSGFYSLHARIEGLAVWRTLDFVLNGIVFLVLGLQLPLILSQIRAVTVSRLVFYGALFSLIVILLRLLWVYPAAWLSAWVSRRLLRRSVAKPSPKAVFLVGWAGMRGVLALAAAFSLPEYLHNGTPFPQRSIIIFLTFCVIFSTLVLQGLSMPALIRTLGLAGVPAADTEEQIARQRMISTALQTLEALRTQAGDKQQEVYDQLENFYRRRLLVLESGPQQERERAAEQGRLLAALAGQLRDAERSVALQLRDENKIHDELLRTLERELDLLDARDSFEE